METLEEGNCSLSVRLYVTISPNIVLLSLIPNFNIASGGNWYGT